LLELNSYPSGFSLYLGTLFSSKASTLGKLTQNVTANTQNKTSQKSSLQLYIRQATVIVYIYQEEYIPAHVLSQQISKRLKTEDALITQ